jgi:acyl-CoA thioesterase FadM
MSVPVSLLRALVGRESGERADLLSTLHQPLRAWPWLCDSLGHINNARYLDLLGYGRLHWLLANGLFRSVLKQRMSFVLAGVGGVYRRQIPRMAPFVLATRLAAYDERWLYYEQAFVLGARGEGAVAARFLARGQIHQGQRSLAPREAIAQCGRALPEALPTPPADLAAWSEAQEGCLAQIRSASPAVT